MRNREIDDADGLYQGILQGGRGQSFIGPLQDVRSLPPLPLLSFPR